MNKFHALPALAFALLTSTAPALAEDVVIHAGRLIDGVSKAPRDKVSILIHDDRITAVAGRANPTEARRH